MAVSYFSLKKNFRFPQQKKTTAWLASVARRERVSLGDIQYVFCTDKFLLELNKQFLNHDTLTDIITFDYSTDLLEGEIYISVDRVKENAKDLDVPFIAELRRVVVHGLLHMAGYKDKTPRQKAQMRKKEEASLSLWR